MDCEMTFLGGAREIGRLGMALSVNGKWHLFDYGITPSDPPKYPLLPPPGVSAAFLTHCHADHSAMLPMVCARGDVQVYGTELTRMVSELICKDSLRVCEIEGYPIPYKLPDIDTFIESYNETEFGENIDLNGISVEMHPAGHIPGAAMFRISSGARSLLFTGDIHAADTKLVDGVKPVQCDTLVMEGTYSGRTHPPRDELENHFKERVREIIEGGGKVILPAFAVGRTQEILMMLADFPYEIWVDGMSNRVSSIYLDERDRLRDPMKFVKALRAAVTVRGREMRENCDAADIILTTSGMLDGGPVLHYLTRFAKDEKSAVFLTGYQVENTNGRRLLEERWVERDGQHLDIKCAVDYFDFSAHADHQQLVKFVKGCSPEKLVICHCDNPQPLLDELKGEFDVVVPAIGESHNVHL